MYTTPSRPVSSTQSLAISDSNNNRGNIQDDEGCRVCHKDNDHANLLLCELCNDEYHIYCLNPPLNAVPKGDFYCDKCHPRNSAYTRDGLEDMVAALPPLFTSRFGEIVWAAGGPGFGYWPACIYDPRLVVGGPRKQALKHLGKKHLVYFFECHELPFSVLTDNKILSWEDGLLEEYDLGKVAKAAGKNRSIAFEQALQAAIMENDKPIEYRLDWNHGGESNFNEIKKAALLSKQRKENIPLGATRKHNHNVAASTDAVTVSSSTQCLAIPDANNNRGNIQDDEGCRVCHKDNDHANLLLCELCNDEYHIYCLNPPLNAVPKGDFYCDKCHPRNSAYTRDGLEDMVAALPPLFTSRFGEIVWAAGGPGFGYWPACIYDPRLVVGGPRKQALKHLGKKHLVYFFECHELPFSVLTDNKILSWEDGLLEEYDLGKVAKAAGKNRSIAFEQALQAAIMENDKPIEYRLDWNHGGESNFNEIKKAALLSKQRKENDAIRKRSLETAAAERQLRRRRRD